MPKNFSLYILIFLSFIIPFYIYNLPTSPSPTSDTIPNTFTAVSVLYFHRLDLTKFRQYLKKRNLVSYMALEGHDGKLYPKTPVVNGILSAPFIYLADKIYLDRPPTPRDFMEKDYESYYQIIGKKYGALLTGLSVIFVFLTLLALFGHMYPAFLIAVIYGTATSAFSTAASGNWQHGPSLLFLTASYFLILQFLQKENKKLLISASLLLALASLIRVINGLFFINIIIIFLISKNKRKYLPLFILPFFSLFAFWNLSMWLLHFPGGYDGEIVRSLHGINPLYSLRVIISLLISPNVGLFVFSPVLAFGFCGLLMVFTKVYGNKKSIRDPQISFLFVSALSVFGLILFNSLWWAWEGGFSYGPRLLTEAVPFLIYLGVYFFYQIKNRLILSLFIMILIITYIYSAAVQTLGVFSYDTVWHSKYYTGRDRMEMAWYRSPSLLNYYAFVKKKYFTMALTRINGKLCIKRQFYLLDFVKKDFKKLESEVKCL